jgi:uncharacterized protein YdeI (YjbR/CyaY-like superfamily)
MTTAAFFKSSLAFRKWLEAHSATEVELLVGFYKVGSAYPSMTWSESVDQALCFGWIDGVRKRMDEHSYTIRFTPRKKTSIWSAVNIAKFEKLRQSGEVAAAGFEAYSFRSEAKSKVYAYEQESSAELSKLEVLQFKSRGSAWEFFSTTPSSYRKVMLHWVTQAKKSDTRASRLLKLIVACEAGVRIQ